MSNEQFIIAFLEKLGDDISRINDTIDKNQDRVSAFIAESTADRRDLRVIVNEIRSKQEGLYQLYERLSDLCGEHKKKGVTFGILGLLTGGSIYFGKLDLQKLLEKIIAFIKG